MLQTLLVVAVVILLLVCATIVLFAIRVIPALFYWIEVLARA
jgi:hypothetical protein